MKYYADGLVSYIIVSGIKTCVASQSMMGEPDAYCPSLAKRYSSTYASIVNYSETDETRNTSDFPLIQQYTVGIYVGQSTL